MKLILGITFFILSPFFALAQTKISGFVLDSDNNAIENASVVVYDSDNNIVAYALTETNGAYVLETQFNFTNHIIVSAQSFGFEKKQTRLNLHLT
ncbi:carboxypeptidase regulatory-like domain-containing protein [Bizionia gelidisalsuginis]|uniref:Carboxypeptidase regulatory-like domain-containing protein n=1 Tax=Bizionia gelidisalsuginis TaxID=291188 RepID=A0ABY3MAC8_9FLAO|nr:carboxypeptidase-like regulatory domain-containing protein [Bizionia gelidisalsuginis]TYC12636.1 carboxypeptidase regulatory-like domain-containing protein [Bizionia gelidisalsuginis]